MAKAAMTIAGSDSGGGAGIQADIKAISATGGYACSVITALTAQNTCGVSAIHSIPAGFIQQQFDAVFSDLDIKAVKIGMLGDVETIQAVANALRQYRPRQVVLDPVMVATSGDALLKREATQALVDELFPLATLITPNLPEALALLGESAELLPENDLQLEQLAGRVLKLGPESVLVKGGHSDGAESTDCWFDGSETRFYRAERIDTQNTHGTGCTLSASIASYLAQGRDLPTAIAAAKGYISQAIAHADQLQIGQGHGPVHHFFAGHYQAED